MIMRKYSKKILSFLLVGLLLVNGMGAFALQKFTDVKEDYWAEPYITKVSDSEVIPGFDDATFRPTDLATKMETVVSIYRMLKATGKLSAFDVDALKTKHMATINEFAIPEKLLPFGSENHEALAVVLEMKIVTNEDLKTFMKDGNFVPVNKLETAVFVGKALNYFLKESTTKIYTFEYKDYFDITYAASPYVDLLITNDIISKNGDQEGKFNAKAFVSREVLSVFLAGTMNKLGDVDETVNGGTETDSSNNGSTSEATQVLEGTVSLVHTDKMLVEIRDRSSKLHVYSLDNTEVYFNGNKVEVANLENGQIVRFTVVGANLTKIEIDKKYEVLTGRFDKLSKTITSDGESYRVLTMKDDSGNFKYKKVFLTTVVELDHALAVFDEFTAGDRIIVSFEDYDAKKIEGFSAKGSLTAVLNRSTDFKKGSVVSVKFSNGNYFEQILENDIEVVKKDEDIKKGDILKIDLEYGVIKKIEATGLSSEATGAISEIIIGQRSYLTIKGANGSSTKYELASNAVVNNLGATDSNGFYALRLEQDVTLKMNGVTVNSISINKSVEKSKFQGSVVEIHKSSNIIKVKDNDGKIWVVSLNSTSSINIADYSAGNNVYVYGVELSDDLFEAELMIVLE